MIKQLGEEGSLERFEIIELITKLKIKGGRFAKRIKEVSMQPNELLDSLVKLRTELELSENIDQETLEQVRAIDSNMHQLIKSNELGAEETISEQLLVLEAKFSVEHPILEKLTRELTDALAKMGI